MPSSACDWSSDVCSSDDRKSTRLNSSHDQISYAVFCLKKKIVIINFPLYRNTARIAWTQVELQAFVSDHCPVDRFGISPLAVGTGSLQYVRNVGNGNAC